MQITEKELQEYFEYCELRKRLNYKTIRAYKNDLKQFIVFMSSNDIEKEGITNYIYFLSQTYTKHKTIKRKIASVKSFFSYLEYAEKIETSPFLKIKTKIKEPIVLPKTIDDLSLKEIFDYLYKNISEADTPFKKKIAVRNAAIIELLFSTGIRISELCDIKAEDINLRNGNLKIYGKGSKERMLYIGNQNVIDVLQMSYNLNEEIVQEKGYLFLNKGGSKLSDQTVRKLLNDIVEKLKIKKHVTPHMFRHTFATRLLDKDVDIRYIQKILGHSSISITQIYTHVSNSKQKEILTMKNPRNDFCSYKL